jgi:hypothetical protein
MPALSATRVTDAWRGAASLPIDEHRAAGQGRDLRSPGILPVLPGGKHLSACYERSARDDQWIAEILHPSDVCVSTMSSAPCELIS